MIELKCPFCQQEYIITKDDSCFGQQRCVCRNPNCEFDGWHFPVKLVSELIRTRKALGIAVDVLTRIAVSPETMMEPEKVVPQLADLALKQITALEQKE